MIQTAAVSNAMLLLYYSQPGNARFSYGLDPYTEGNQSIVPRTPQLIYISKLGKPL